MGTNYYAVKKKPRIVKVYDNFHLGKGSLGNPFAIQTQPAYYRSFDEFKEFVLTNEEFDIVDEYGRKHEKEDLLEYIKEIGYEFEDREFS